MKARDLFEAVEGLEPGAPFNVNALSQGWREIKTPAEMLEHTPWGQWWLAMIDHSHKPRRIRGEHDVKGIVRIFQRELDQGARAFFHFDEDNCVDYGVSVYNGRILEVAYRKPDSKPHRVDTDFVDRESGAPGEQWKGAGFSPLTDWKDQTSDLDAGGIWDNLLAELSPEFKDKFKKSWEKFNNDSDWRLSDDEYILLGLAIQRGVWPNGERMTPEEKLWLDAG